MNEVFLDNLPRWGKGGKAKEGTINWGNSSGKFILFNCLGIKGKMKIINHYTSERKVKILYNENEYIIYTDDILNCRFSKILGKRTGEFKKEIGDLLKDKNRNFVIISKQYKTDKNGITRKYYKFKCQKCSFECGEHYKNGEYKEEYWIEESGLLRGNNCPCCTNKIVVPNINSIVANKETHWMIPYFQGGYDEAKMYTYGSDSKTKFKCPDCGRVKDKPLKICNIYKNHSIGCDCGDGIKYPEKFMTELLNQLKIIYISQYNPDWIKPKRYDFYIPSKNLIIEMDGGLGHGNVIHPKSKKTAEETLNDDLNKDKKANEHGIEVVRIDCNYGNINNRFEYIKNNTISKLSDEFNLSNIDWNKCDLSALSNVVKTICEFKINNEDMTLEAIADYFSTTRQTIRSYLNQGSKVWDWINYDSKKVKDIEKELLLNRIEEACNYKKNNPAMSTKDIGNIMNLNRGTIIRYLKYGSSLGLCNYNPKEEIGIKSKELCSKATKVFDINMNLIYISPSVAECGKQAEEMVGVKLNKGLIASVCRGERKHHKGFIFKYTTQDEYKKWIEQIN